MDIKGLDEGENNEISNGKTTVQYADKDYLKKDIDGWEVFIKKLNNFKGNETNAAVLLYYFTEGVKDTYKKNPEIVPKALGVVSTESEFPPFLSSEQYGLVISQKKLEEYSVEDYADTVEVWNSGVLTYKGKIANFYRLGGKEEARHDVFRYEHGIKIDTRRTAAQELGIVGYDATDIELDGLKHQISYAKEKNMGEDTVNVLQTRHNNAIKFREKLDNPPY